VHRGAFQRATGSCARPWAEMAGANRLAGRCGSSHLDAAARRAGSRTMPIREWISSCVLAHFDHEWHRDDSELLRANPDHDATMPAPHPFRNPAVGLHWPTCAAAHRWFRFPSVRWTSALCS